jgi:hypothetical protein
MAAAAKAKRARMVNFIVVVGAAGKANVVELLRIGC